MEFLEYFLETFLEGSVDHVIYRDYIVNRRFFMYCSLACEVGRLREEVDSLQAVDRQTCIHTSVYIQDSVRHLSVEVVCCYQVTSILGNVPPQNNFLMRRENFMIGEQTVSLQGTFLGVGSQTSV